MKAPIPDISRDLFDLTGYCSIVTGASVGIGLSIAEALAYRVNALTDDLVFELSYSAENVHLEPPSRVGPHVSTPCSGTTEDNVVGREFSDHCGEMRETASKPVEFVTDDNIYLSTPHESHQAIEAMLEVLEPETVSVISSLPHRRDRPPFSSYVMIIAQFFQILLFLRRQQAGLRAGGSVGRPRAWEALKTLLGGDASRQ